MLVNRHDELGQLQISLQ
ncbi:MULTISPECIES: hypothetical protein [Pseudomonas]